jgi:hypothetical protein
LLAGGGEIDAQWIIQKITKARLWLNLGKDILCLLDGRKTGIHKPNDGNHGVYLLVVMVVYNS